MQTRRFTGRRTAKKRRERGGGRGFTLQPGWNQTVPRNCWECIHSLQSSVSEPATSRPPWDDRKHTNNTPAVWFTFNTFSDTFKTSFLTAQNIHPEITSAVSFLLYDPWRLDLTWWNENADKAALKTLTTCAKLCINEACI